MKCAKLHLLERSRPRTKLEVNLDKPRRYCQKRMINPSHEEDPRWNDLADRFCCNTTNESINLEPYDNTRVQGEVEDLFLSVQNLQFKGDIQHRKKTRAGFKYTTLSDGKKHRMFVKQIVSQNEEPDTVSELTTYYYDDYFKYILSGNECSRPSSAKSSKFLTDCTNKRKENKSIQVDITEAKERKETRRPENNGKKAFKEDVKPETKDKINNEINIMEDTKVCFQKRGKRKSLTISRTESPATVQIIRVDVVCNYSSSSTSTVSDYDDKKQAVNNELLDKKEDKKRENVKVKNTRFANKYLLTKTVKTLDENVSGGSKVTLLCKTFRLADRSKFISKRKSSKNVKDVTNATERVQK